MLSNLIYVSVRKSSCTEEMIQEILQSSIKNNKKNNITGILLYSELHFIQYLEGEKESLEACYAILEADQRHKFPKIIDKHHISERAFPTWHMAAKKFTPNNLEFLTEITPTEKKMIRTILKSEAVDRTKLLDMMRNLFLYG